MTTLSGTTGNDILRGYAGSDFLSGGAGDDMLFGDDGDDHLDGGFGGNTIVGGNGNDELQGAGVLRGGPGSDRIYAFYSDHNVLYGDAGDDDLRASGPDDVLRGGDGDDWLHGSGDGMNTLYGGAGDDTFETNSTDSEIMVGGPGMDTYLPAGLPGLDVSTGSMLIVDVGGGFQIKLGSDIPALDSDGDGWLTDADEFVELVDATYDGRTAASLQLSFPTSGPSAQATLFHMTHVSADVLVTVPSDS